MITIKAIITDNMFEGEKIGEFCQPKRMLTAKEKLTVTSTKSDGTNFIYYQNDEPI